MGVVIEYSIKSVGLVLSEAAFKKLSNMVFNLPNL